MTGAARHRWGLPPRLKSWLFIVGLIAFSVLVQSEWIGTLSLFGSLVHWKGLQAFLKQNNEGFVIAAVVAIYMDLVKPNTFSDFFRAGVHTLDDFLRSTSPAAGVDFFLARHYPGQDGLQVLRETVVSDKATLLECRVRLWLTQDPSAPPGQPADIRRYRVSFKADIDRFIFATVRNLEVSELVFLRGPDVTELTTVPKGADFAAATREILAAQPVRCGARPLVFEPYRGPLDPALEAGAFRRGVDFEIFSAAVPSDEGRWRQFTVDTTRRMDRAGHGQHHWIADRPLFLRDVTIDVTGLPDRQALEFDVIPFLGSVDNIGPTDFRTGECVIHVNSWLVRGQGICLVWGPSARP